MDKRHYLGQALILQMFLYLTQNICIYLIQGLSSYTVTIATLLMNIVVFSIPLYFYRTKTGYVPYLWEHKTKKPEYTPLQIAVLYIFGLSLTIMSITLIGNLLNLLLSYFGLDILSSKAPSDAFGVIMMFVKSVILAAFLEETLFRGAVFHAYSEIDAKKTIFASAFLFALMHYNLFQFLYAFIAGLIISIFAYKTKSLIFAFAIHMGSNLLTYISLLVSEFAPSASHILDLIFTIVFSVIAVMGLVVFAVIKLKSPKPEENKTVSSENPSRIFTPELSIYAVLSVVLALLNVFKVK